MKTNTLISLISAIITVLIFVIGFNVLYDEMPEQAVQYCENNPDKYVEGDLEFNCSDLLEDVYGEDYCNMSFIHCVI